MLLCLEAQLDIWPWLHSAQASCRRRLPLQLKGLLGRSTTNTRREFCDDGYYIIKVGPSSFASPFSLKL